MPPGELVQPAQKPFPWTYYWIGLASVAYISGFIFGMILASPSVKLWLNAIGPTLPLLLAIRYFLRAADSNTGRPGGSAWYFFSAVALLWSVGRLLQALLFAQASVAAARIIDEVFILAGYAGLLAGLLYLLPQAMRSYGRLRLLLDILISGLALTSLIGLLLTRPVLDQSIQTGFYTSWAAAAPLAAVFMIVTLANGILLLDAGGLRRGIMWMLLGMLFILASEGIEAYSILRGSSILSTIYSAGWTAGYTILAITAYFYNQAGNYKLSRRFNEPDIWRMIQQVLPFASTIVLVWYAVLDWQFSQEFDPVVPGLAVVCILLLVLRQGVAAGELDLQEYTLLVESAAEPSFTYSSKGILKLANPALAEISGYTPEGLVGRLLSDLFPGIDWTSGKTPGGWSEETKLRSASGEDIPVYLSLRPVQRAGERISAVAGTAHDLRMHLSQQEALQAAYNQVATARRDLENLNTGLEERIAEKTRSLSEALVRLEDQNRTLQSLDQLKTDFVSLVSHELRAPLTNIAGGIELVLSSPDALLPEVQETLSLVEKEILRLSTFVESILDTSALEAGHVPVSPAPVSLSVFIHNLIERWMSLRGLEKVELNLSPDLPLINADERALTSVFYHLIDNAQKYAPDCAMTISAWRKRNFVYVSLEDNGPGFPFEGISSIFEKFTRLQSKDSQTVYGHGLGLFMTRRLLQAMKGDIQADNRPGGGARFIFWLPAIQE